MTEAGVYVGVDLGTSGLKAVAVAGDGSVLGRVVARYPTHRERTGAAEQDPADWVAALALAVSELVRSVPAPSWRAVALSAMIPTLVAVGADGAAIGPAVTWEDSRAEAQAADLRRGVGPQALYSLTGQWVDARYLLPMYLRRLAVYPEQAAGTTRIAGAKDYLVAWLTGRWVTDPSTATGFGCYDLAAGAWSSQVRDVAEILAGCPLPGLPDIVPSDQVLSLTPDAAHVLGLASGLPVVIGAADSVLGALGLGVREAGAVAYVSGTSTVILSVSRTPQRDSARRYLVTPLAGIDGWGLEMDLLATGASIRWLAELLGVDEPGVIELASRRRPEEAPVFLPFLAPGEQGALWDPELTGTLGGLTLRHGPTDVARGLLNGIVIESARCLAVLEDATGVAGPVMVAGSSAASVRLRQDLADASGREVVSGPFADYSALGAAVLAAQAVAGVSFPPPTGAGAGPGSVDGAAGAGAPRSGVLRPDPEARGAWGAVASRHDELLHAVRRRSR